VMVVDRPAGDAGEHVGHLDELRLRRA